MRSGPRRRVSPARPSPSATVSTTPRGPRVNRATTSTPSTRVNEEVVDRAELAGVGRAEDDQHGGDPEVQAEERDRAGADAAGRRRGGVGDEAHLPLVDQLGGSDKEGSGHGPG